MATEAGQDKPATPAEQYKALLKQFQTASSGRVTSDEERMKFVGQVYKHRTKLAEQLIDLAGKYPKDPVAIDALIQAVWQVNGTPWPVELVGPDTAHPKAFAILERDYIQSDKLGSVCPRIAFGFRKEYESFLRAVLARNPHREVQGQACLALAHYLNNRRQRIDMAREQPAIAKEFAGLFGTDYLQELLRQDPAQAAKESEALLERATEEFGDVKIGDGGTVGEKAKAALFEMRHLSIGKTAPDIDGVDQNGVPLKLSDYRGKVVLLDFWSEY